MEADDIRAIGRDVFDIELSAIQRLRENLDDSFVAAVRMIYHSRGRVVVTGIGKSGLIGRKIAATMTSTGTPAIFLHPVEGVHGDLGLVTNADVILAISKSGQTVELNHLLPLFRRYGCPIIAMTGNPASRLAQFSNVHLDISVTEEACPFDLAPTASTTAALVMGDALAIALLKMKNFRVTDFARNHPGGAIGWSLLKVSDLMKTGADIPLVMESTDMPKVLLEMSSKRLGMTCVVDESGHLTGIITDGDLRRWLATSPTIAKAQACEVMVRNPKTVSADILAGDAVDLMEHNAITTLIVVDDTNQPRGVIHLHDLVKSGVSYRGKGPQE